MTQDEAYRAYLVEEGFDDPGPASGQGKTDWLAGIKDTFGLGLQTYKTIDELKDRKKPVQRQTQPAPQPAWIKPAIIGGVVLVVLVVVVSLFRK